MFNLLREIFGWGVSKPAMEEESITGFSNYVMSTAYSMAHMHQAFYDWRTKPELADKFTNPNNIVRTIFLEAAARHSREARTNQITLPVESHVIDLCNEIRDEYELFKSPCVYWKPGEVEILAAKIMAPGPSVG